MYGNPSVRVVKRIVIDRAGPKKQSKPPGGKNFSWFNFLDGTILDWLLSSLLWKEAKRNGCYRYSRDWEIYPLQQIFAFDIWSQSSCLKGLNHGLKTKIIVIGQALHGTRTRVIRRSVGNNKTFNNSFGNNFIRQPWSSQCNRSPTLPWLMWGTPQLGTWWRWRLKKHLSASKISTTHSRFSFSFVFRTFF